MAWVTAYFERQGIPATGLIPLIRIRQVDTENIVAEDYMEEVSDGFYRFEFITYDITKNYTILADSVTLKGNDRFLEGTSGEYGEVSNNISIMSGNIDCRVLLMKKLFTNKLELNDGDQDNWILYDDDDTTPLFTFDATDKNNNFIRQIIGNASKRSKAIE
jgi:hypothetical protein